jgi:hypothetical protein
MPACLCSLKCPQFCSCSAAHTISLPYAVLLCVRLLQTLPVEAYRSRDELDRMTVGELKHLLKVSGQSWKQLHSRQLSGRHSRLRRGF